MNKMKHCLLIILFIFFCFCVILVQKNDEQIVFTGYLGYTHLNIYILICEPNFLKRNIMCTQCFVQLYQEIIGVYQKSAVHIIVRFKKFGSHINITRIAEQKTYL
jgi:hypothetical protein